MVERRSDIELREFLEHMIEQLDKRIDIRLCALSKALELQAKEYERRLTDLNHEQARLASDRNRFVPLDVFYPFRDALEKWQAIMSTFKDQYSGRDKGLSIAWIVLVALFGILTGIVVYFK